MGSREVVLQLCLSGVGGGGVGSEGKYDLCIVRH